MKLPRTNKTRLARMVTVLATTFLVASGLCGVNFGAVLLFAPDFISDGGGVRSLPTRILSVTAVIELAVIALSLAGLLMAAVAMLFHHLTRPRSDAPPTTPKKGGY